MSGKYVSPYLRVWQAAKILGLSRERIHQMIKKGTLKKGEVTTGHFYHITRESFEIEKARREEGMREIMEEELLDEVDSLPTAVSTPKEVE